MNITQQVIKIHNELKRNKQYGHLLTSVLSYIDDYVLDQTGQEDGVGQLTNQQRKLIEIVTDIVIAEDEDLVADLKGYLDQIQNKKPQLKVWEVFPTLKDSKVGRKDKPLRYLILLMLKDLAAQKLIKIRNGQLISYEKHNKVT